jgi:GDP-L-fucose synthase
VKKLLFLGSSCIYPKAAPQPIKEEYFLTGPLEPTNEPYAIAKITGIKLCDAYRAQYGCNFISAMPTNLYGPNDNYNLENSHVLPALLRKCIEATRSNAAQVVIWGSGNPRREFLHVDDFAEACYFMMQNYDEPGFVNVGTGVDISIRELTEKLTAITGFKGEIVYDASKPDGMARKLLDVSRLTNLGWSAQIDLDTGLARTYEAVKAQIWKD